MPIVTTVASESTRASFRGMRTALDAIELVDSYCVDYLNAEGIVDRDALGRERVDHVMRTLAELDGVAELELDSAFVPRTVLQYTSATARCLAAAIREALAGESEPVSQCGVCSQFGHTSDEHEAAGL